MFRIFRHYVHVWQIGLGLCDAAILLSAYYTGLFTRFANIDNFANQTRLHTADAAIFVGVLLVAMYAFGVYQSRVQTDWGAMLMRLAVGFLAGFVGVASIQYAFPSVTFWRSSLAIALAVAFIGVIVVRLICLPLLRKPAFRRRVVVLGTGERAQRIEALEQGSGGHNFQCLGFISLGDNDVNVTPSRVLRGVPALRAVTEANQIDEIVVAMQDRRGEWPVDALLDLKMSGVEITEFATFWERQTGRIDLANIYPSWLIFSDGFDAGVLHRALKRLFDLVASLAGAIFLMPLAVLAAIAVKLESRGPALYRQERVGLHGHTFKLAKFRSMRVDAEKDTGPTWAAERDPRITAVGRFLRFTRIDELPQIFNVLRGEMSFIGPRPERPFFVDRLAADIPYYRERHRVKPGISGWAQLNYPYGASVEDARNKLEYDLFYAKNHTLALDVLILLQTARVVLWPDAVR
jgi:sugar transferase (PEP-CTERM system associated)